MTQPTDTAQSAAPFKRHVDMTADEIREKYRYDQNWPIQSFDAKDWAKAFIDTLGARISYQLDEATMLGWFANALMRGWDERQWRLDAEAARLNQPAAPEQESGDEREALIEIGAKALYDETPLEEGGEAIDGFQVSPNTTVTWAQIVEHDGYAEIASDFRRMARTVLTAAWQAARAAAPASPLTEEERQWVDAASNVVSTSEGLVGSGNLPRHYGERLLTIIDRLTGKE